MPGDDDWDDTAPASSAPAFGVGGFSSGGGINFSGGRGFKPAAQETNGDSWGGGSSSGFGSGGGNRWGDASEDSGDRRGRGGRGGGRGGFRGGRGGRRDGFENGGDSGGGGWGQSNGGYGKGDDNGGGGYGRDNEDGGGRGRGRGGRGGRGGGRGGRGGFGDRDRDNENGGGFGGGGGGSWGDGGGGFKRDGEDGEEKPKPEIYIPVQNVTEENMFTDTTITSGVNFMKLDDIEVKVTGEDIPTPFKSFDDSGLRPLLLTNVEKSGYTKPTPIQRNAIPIIMAKRDVMACAQTGSGKTAAFLLPIIHRLMVSNDSPVVDGSTAKPKAVIVSPTRELAIQIFEQAQKFAYNSIVKAVVVYGGTSVRHQAETVRNGCHILVATPGRLNDFVEKGTVAFDALEFFVLDEADRMLDMGFLPTVELMLGHPSIKATGERQTLMFSATFPEEIQHLAGKFLHQYVFIAVGIVGSASTDVEQRVFEVSKFDKREKLLELLKENPGERIVVFVETKRNADFLAIFLNENSIQSTSIHGDRLQREREQALWDFKKGIRNILVATGVAARGLDIQGIQHVINYDLPKSIDEYVHRIGRTGRVGNKGKATSFYDSSCDSNLSSSLANILKQAGQEIPDFIRAGGHGDGFGGGSFGGRDIRGDDFGQAQDFVKQPAAVEDEW